MARQGNRPVTLKRHIRDELESLRAEPARVYTERGAWVLGIAKKHKWYPRVAAGVVAEANKIGGNVR